MTVPAPNWGDVPGWIEAGGVVAALFHAVTGARREWATSWPRLVQELADLDGGEIGRIVQEHPQIAELVGNAWETASRTATEEKRWLLARVAAQAIKGPDDTRIDELALIVRTVAALDPSHVTLLVVIAQPSPGKGQLADSVLEGAVTDADLRELWPEVGDLAGPLLSVLQREGLIKDVGTGTWDNPQAWSVTDYARRFLRFLPGDQGRPDDWLERAEVLLRLPQRSDFSVRNLGPAPAATVRVRLIREGGFDIHSFELPPDELPPGTGFGISNDLLLANEPPFNFWVTWRDGRGLHDCLVTLHPPS